MTFLVTIDLSLVVHIEVLEEVVVQEEDPFLLRIGLCQDIDLISLLLCTIYVCNFTPYTYGFKDLSLYPLNMAW